MNLLEINEVSKHFNKTVAVDKLSLNIPKQSIFGLLGPNGAGKTTLIRMITNIVPPDSGSILLEGENNPEKRMYQVGYMPEERGLYKKMKVGEQLLYLARLKNHSKAEAKEAVEKWLADFEISDWWNKKVEDLSKGMQQKIQFISTVIHQPPLVILDEPFSGLDPVNTNLIRREIDKLRDNGATILFSTHRMEQVEQICDHIALVHKGKKVLEGKTAEVQQRFKQNLFSIKFSNPVVTPFQDEHFDIRWEGNNSAKVKLKENQSATEILQFLLQKGVEINAFNEILPTINEIFIDQVSGSQELN